MASQHNNNSNGDKIVHPAFVYGGNNNNETIGHEQGDLWDERIASSLSREHPLNVHQQVDQPGE